MSQLNKLSIKKISFSLAVLSACLISVSFVPIVSAQNKLIVPIAGITHTNVSLTDYVKTIYIWGIGLAALLAVLMIVIGGAQYIFAAGSFGEAEAGKSRITSAIYGIILLLGISLILSTLGVRLRIVSLDPLALNPNNLEMQRLLDDLLIDGKLENDSNLAGYEFLDIKDLATVANKAKALESARDAGKITSATYDANLKKMHQEFNEQFNDPALFEKMKALNKTFYEATHAPYTEADLTRSTQEQLKTKREVAYGKLIGGLSDKKNPLILAQKKINSGGGSAAGTTTPSQGN